MNEHLEQTTNLLGSIHLDTSDVYEQSPAARSLRLQLASVQATLYLAEQLRTTNLIAAITKWGGNQETWPLAIREALGVS